MQIALYQPDIPQNLGTILRLCACTDVACHIIEPCGFLLDDKRMKRAAMDYADNAHITRHVSWERFLGFAREREHRLLLLSTKATREHWDFTYKPGDILLFGRESAGVPQEVAEAADERLRIAMAPHARSLNVAVSAGIALFEGLRQTRL